MPKRASRVIIADVYFVSNRNNVDPDSYVSIIIADVYFVSNRNMPEDSKHAGIIIADVYFVSNRNVWRSFVLFPPIKQMFILCQTATQVSSRVRQARL